MQSQEPLTVTVQPAPLECWNDQSTASALKALLVWLHSTGLSLRETTALEKFGVIGHIRRWFSGFITSLRRCQTRQARPQWVAIDETAITIGTDQYWLYAVIDVETKLLRDVFVSRGMELI